MVLAQPDVLVALERVLDPNILDDRTRQNIFELRLTLEMGLADLLFVRKDAPMLQALEKVIHRESKAKSDAERVKCDIDFHAMLYKMAGNELLERFQKLLLPVFDYEVALEAKMNGTAPTGKVTHQDLLEILKNGNPDSFRSAMYLHLKPHFDRID